MPFNFSKLRGRKVSILIQGLSKKEAYVGFIKEVEGDFLTLTLLQSSSLQKQRYPIEELVVRTSIIESVWVYKNAEA